MGRRKIFSQPEAPLDLTTPLETVFILGAVFSGVAVVIVLLSEDPQLRYLIWASASLALFCFAYSKTNCLYIIDNERECIDYYRSFFGLETRYRVLSFKDLAAVTVAGYRHSSKSSTWWEYHVTLVSRDGRVITVSDGIRNAVEDANAQARELALTFECHYLPCEEEHNLKVEYDKVRGQVNIKHLPFFWWNRIGSWLAIIAFSIALLTLAFFAFVAVRN